MGLPTSGKDMWVNNSGAGKSRLPQLAALSAIGVLALAALGWGIHRWRAHAASGAPQASAQGAAAPALPARHYAEPLIRALDLGLDKEEVSEEEADRALHRFKPREDRDAWPLKLPLDWGADPFNDRNWRFQLQSLGMVKPLLARYLETGDHARYRQVLAFTLDWWRYHRDLAKPPEYAWYNMSMGLRASVLALLLDRAFSGREQLSAADQAALLEMAAKHVEQLTAVKTVTSSNHGVFQIQGLANLCRVIGDAGACVPAQQFVRKNLTMLLDAQFNADGVHRENSPQYHRLAIEAFEPLADPNGKGIYKEVAERLDLARDVFPWFVFPDGRLAQFGDTEGEAPTTPPHARRHCSEKENDDCIELGDLSKSGYIVVRSPWTQKPERAFMLIMTGIFWRKGHKHVDDLSFELMDRGELLFQDSGKYAYLNDSMSAYVKGASAHNTIGLSNRQIRVKDTRYYGSALEKPRVDGDTFVLRGKVTRRKLFTQARQIDYAPEHYLLIDDELTSNKGRSYESNLHLAPQLKPKLEGDAFIVPRDGRPSMRVESLSSDCKASEVRGQRKPVVQGWVTKAYRDMTPASVLNFTCKGKSRRITLLVSFDEQGHKQGLARYEANSKPGKRKPIKPAGGYRRQ